MRHALALLVLSALMYSAGASDYGLVPRSLGDGVYVFVGRDENFSFANGGNIVNTGFVVTTAGVLVINSGPSRLYGEQMRAAIAKQTNQPIAWVLNLKLHPDHFLGNQAFADVPIGALAGTIAGIRAQGEQFSDNLYRMVGRWMRGTEIVLPTELVTPGEWALGDRVFELIALQGHTSADLLVLDRKSGVLFAGGLVFNRRAPTTPHADLDLWMTSLEELGQIPFAQIVPSHGPVADSDAPILATGEYLRWLRSTLRDSAQAGWTMAEMYSIVIPQPFADWAVMPEEYHRSVSHLFDYYESEALPQVAGPAD